jgi:hypothetical protein
VKKKLLFPSFRFECFASDQSEINRAYIFALFRFQQFFVSLLFRVVFASLHFRFASDSKTSEKTFFSHRSEKILFLFRFKAKMIAVFRFRFTSFHFKAKMMEAFASVLLHFASKRK